MVSAIRGIQGSWSTTRMRAFGAAEGLKQPLDHSTRPGQALVSVLVDLPVPAPVAPLAFFRLGSGRFLLFRTFSRRRGARAAGRVPTLKAGVEAAAPPSVARTARRATAE